MPANRPPPLHPREREGSAGKASSREFPISALPVGGGARGSYVGAYLLGGVLVMLLVLRFAFGP
jgi:hypothetical protein